MKILQKLISIESVTGNEGKIQEYICGQIKRSGFDSIWVGKNLVLKIKGKNTKNALIFNSHVDTVGPGKHSLWKYPPYSGRIHEGKIYGLGASDEKASIAVSLSLINFYQDNIPGCDVYFTFVVNEEKDGSGTKEVLNWFCGKKFRYKNVSGILGEPTGLIKIETGHKGNIFIKVTTFGKSGHGSVPIRLADHALAKMYKVVKRFGLCSKKWSQEFADENLGKPTIGLVTSIKAGDQSSPNKFPDSCEATFDIRTTPKIHKKIFDMIKTEVCGIDNNARIEYLFDPAYFGYTRPEEKIVRIIKSISKAELGISKSSNDMCFFTEKGIPAVVFGAGEHSVIHSPREYCEIGKIYSCIDIYKKVVSEFAKID